MAKLEIPDSNLKQIIAEVESELATMFKSEPLAKAFPPKDETLSDDGGKAAALPEDNGPAADAAPLPKATEVGASEAPPAAAPAAAPEAPQAVAGQETPAEESLEGQGDPAMAQAPDVESLKAEYASLSPEELKMHFLAAKEALFEMMGGHGDAEPAPAPEVPAVPAPEMAMKMELEAVAPNKKASAPSKERLEEVQPSEKFKEGKDRLEAVAVKKSEAEVAELEALKKHVKDQDDALGQLVNAVKMVFERPERKAVTSIEAIAKPGADSEAKKLSKAEVWAKVNELSQTPTLKKSDRELINAYVVGSVSVEKIEHLLK